MSFWQPRSLQQLVLVSFFAALAPLCLAILFTVQTLGELSDKNRAVGQAVVDATRLGQEIQRDVLDLERRARQYLALADIELAQLFDRERDRLQDKLDALQAALPSNSPDIVGLRGSLGQLQLPAAAGDGEDPAAALRSGRERLDHEFAVINEQSRAVRTWLQSSVDQLLRGSSREAQSLIDNLSLQLSLLAAATLALLLLLAWWINKPVRDLTKEIHQLGTAGLSHSIEISGPLELQALGSELEWLRQSLHESEQQKEQFLRHISHELKTPLASLREGADLLADQVPGHLSQTQLEIVQIVRQNGIELQRLIENLIDYNRLPAQELNCERFALDALWDELLNNYQLSLDKKALRLSRECAVEHWVADRDRLRTSLDNLLSNAVNYTPEGGRIVVVCRQQGGNLVIDVANSGEPIPSEDAQRVFEPFFQSAAKRTGPIKGSGIGLSVARECIEAQGGTLSLVDHPTLPICFRLTCPAHSAH
ncbi:MAG: two-component sensor histidine kinase [Halioglobus sp.]|nr:two-component sensor histidine kinase [Halioglobus sp.]|tara:strand:- start:2231 stop:3673 length:1443 start_codon:yes stop_codon:yes gene_type:complete